MVGWLNRAEVAPFTAARTVVVDHTLDVLDIEATLRDIGRHKHLHTCGAHIERPQSLTTTSHWIELIEESSPQLLPAGCHP